MYLKDEEWKFSTEAEVRNGRFGDVNWEKMPTYAHLKVSGLCFLFDCFNFFPTTHPLQKSF